MLLNENLSVFTDNEFSTKATVFGTTQNLDICGIFDEEHDLSFDSSGAPTENRKINFLVCRDEVEGEVEHGTEIEIENVTFEVIGIEPTCEGELIELVLKKIDG